MSPPPALPFFVPICPCPMSVHGIVKSRDAAMIKANAARVYKKNEVGDVLEGGRWVDSRTRGHPSAMAASLGDGSSFLSVELLPNSSASSAGAGGSLALNSGFSWYVPT